MRTRVLLAALAALTATATASATPHVVGGQTIQIQAAPWTVYVQHTASGKRFLCTGSVVDASHVLTAAHCLFDDGGNLGTASSFQVRAGVSNFSQPLASDQEQDRGVSLLRVHPGYRWTARVAEDDVAVLALVSPLDLSTPAVQAVALPSSGAYPAGAAAGAAGFGLQAPTAAASGQLSWMTATVDPQGECGGHGGLLGDNAVILCAFSPSSALCNGDSGSGLVTTGDTPVLVGVVDASSSCGVGTHAVLANTAAPEILSFVQGNDHPPTAPRDDDSTFVRLTWKGGEAPAVGQVLSCSTGGWSDSAVDVTYSFLNASTGEALQTGWRSTFVAQAAQVGIPFRCEVAVANAGGTTLAETTASPPLAPAPAIKIERSAPVSARRGGDAWLKVTVVTPLGLEGRVSVCLSPPAAVAGHLCKKATDDGNYHYLPVIFHFRVKRSAPVGTAHVAVTAVAGVSRASSSALLRVTAT